MGREPIESQEAEALAATSITTLSWVALIGQSVKMTVLQEIAFKQSMLRDVLATMSKVVTLVQQFYLLFLLPFDSTSRIRRVQWKQGFFFKQWIWYDELLNLTFGHILKIGWWMHGIYSFSHSFWIRWVRQLARCEEGGIHLLITEDLWKQSSHKKLHRN